MIPALISTFIKAFADVFWKKSLIYSVRPYAHNLASYPMAIALLCYLLISGVSFENFDLIFCVVVMAITTINVLSQPIRQQIYREENISIIMPYTNLNKIFIIIVSFFLFQDVSVITFFIILFTVLVIITASINFKEKRLPKNIGKIVASELLTAISILLVGYLVIYYGKELYFTFLVLLGFVAYVFLNIYSGEIQDLLKAPRAYWKIRPLGALGWVAGFISLIVIDSLGLSLSILLGFLGVGMTLIFSYFFLADKPSRKNLFLTIIVSGLIGIGYYFK